MKKVVSAEIHVYGSFAIFRKIKPSIRSNDLVATRGIWKQQIYGSQQEDQSHIFRFNQKIPYFCLNLTVRII